MAATDKVRIAATADLHFSMQSPSLSKLWTEISRNADILVLCGDLTDYGLPKEAELLAKDLNSLSIPAIAVLGNHDYQSGHAEEVKQILSDGGLRILDGESCEIEGIGFGGAKGFAGGFGRRALEPWGESSIKNFVQEALDETLKLESALARLRTPHRVALLHYAPIQATVEGEPPEIYAFLGSSRHEEPLNRYEVSVAFHGHAHRGQPEGRTQTGIPVYNVSWPLMSRTWPDRPPFRLVEFDRQEEVKPAAPGTESAWHTSDRKI